LKINTSELYNSNKDCALLKIVNKANDNKGINNNGHHYVTSMNNSKMNIKNNNTSINNNLISKNLTSFNFRSLLTSNNTTTTTTTENIIHNIDETKESKKIKQERTEQNKPILKANKIIDPDELNVEDLSTIIKNLNFKGYDLYEDNLFKTEGNVKYDQFVKQFSNELENKIFSEL
jgi:hypothetical protein